MTDDPSVMENQSPLEISIPEKKLTGDNFEII